MAFRKAQIVAAYAGMVAIWGTTWLAIKYSLRGLPPITGVGLRFLIAGLAMYAIAAALRTDFRKDRPPFHLVAVLAFALFGANYVLNYFAETHLASGLVAVLFGTMPLFVFGFAHFMVGERAGLRRIAGTLLALGGVATISLAADVRADIPYVLAGLGAGMSAAFGSVYLKRFARFNPLTTLSAAMLLSGVVLSALGIAVEHVDWRRAVEAPSVVALLYLALGGSVLAFYLNHWLLQRLESSIVGLSMLMIPVIALVVGAAFGSEVFGLRDIAGTLLVIAGIWTALSRRRPSREPIAEIERAA